MMNYDLSYVMASGVGIAILVFTLVLCVLAIVAYFFSIGQLVRAANSKGYSGSNAKLWIIGLFMSPLVLALVVIAMPDHARHFE